MDLIVFHYHLLPGGVTDVITRGSVSLLQNAPDIRSITVVCGNPENSEAVTRNVHQSIAQKSRFSVEIMPEIGYASADRLAGLAPAPEAPVETDRSASAKTSAASFRPVGSVSDVSLRAGTEELAKRIAQTISARFGGTEKIWWIHNHHLGKNPAFTKAVQYLTETLPEQKILLQIHDFPECGRFSNLRLLERAGADSLYPRGPAVVYVTINSRDQKILRASGVSPVHYLANPVSLPSTPPSTVHDSPPLTSVGIRERLFDHFGARFPLCDPRRPLYLYPVRTIRRKNVLEAALITRLLDVNLVVTLPGVSHAEKNYSQMVHTAFAEGIIPGLWGIGTELDDAGITFGELQAASDVILSSSVQEGFGYQYVSALTLGKPLVARYLDVLGDVEPLFDGFPHHFYRRVMVPAAAPSLSDPLPLLRFRYDEHTERLIPVLGQEAVDRIREELAAKIGPDGIEFSYLLPQMQFTYLKDMRDTDGFTQKVHAMNAGLLDTLDILGSDPDSASDSGDRTRSRADIHARLEAQLGPAAFASRFQSVVNTNTLGVIPRPTQFTSVLAAFATDTFHRLLYEQL